MGVVGGGQLALMMAQAAEGYPFELHLLASSPEDPAVALFSHVSYGDPSDPAILRAFAAHVDVVTFDHELVARATITKLEGEGVTFRPSSSALHWASDKAYQRQHAAAAGIATPDFVVVRPDERHAIDAFAQAHPEGVVVKSAGGGYDGRGVDVCDDLDAVHRAVDHFADAGTLVLEARVTLLAEVAVSVVTAVDRSTVVYPCVRTVQHYGTCTEVLVPSHLSPALEDAAVSLARRVARLVGAIGVVAVELFVTPDGLVLNEVATRPHNSGHWSIEGARTSQFLNHLNAVAGYALGATDLKAPHVCMVNLLGGASPVPLENPGSTDGVYVHDYRKAHRPGRKLGHVTALGTTVDDVRDAAWSLARHVGTERRKEPL